MGKMSTPKEEGYFMPAEWHPHTATWMAWAGLEEAYRDAPQGSQRAFRLVTEGGAIHVDGEGTLLATEKSIINPNRNAGLSRRQIEIYLMDYLNIEKIIWLNGNVHCITQQQPRPLAASGN